MPDFPIKLTGRHAGPDTVRALHQGRIQWPLKMELWWSQLVTLADFTPDAATTQTLTLNTLFANNAFPAEAIILPGTLVRNVTLPTGTPTALTLTVGGTFDAGVDADGLLTTSNLLGSGAAAGDMLQTTAAANYTGSYESAFSPTVFLTATGANLDTLTAVSFEVLIPWTPRTQVAG